MNDILRVELLSLPADRCEDKWPFAVPLGRGGLLPMSRCSESLSEGRASAKDLLDQPTPCFRLQRMAKKLQLGGSFGLVLDVAGEVFAGAEELKLNVMSLPTVFP